MIRLVTLLFLCGAITGSNDTLSNVIPGDERPDLGKPNKEEENNVVATHNRTLNEIYADAVHAYLEEDWDRCIEDFNALLHGYKVYKRMTVNCRQKCRAAASGADPILPENIEDLHFYEKKVRETLCLLMCNEQYREIAGAKALKALPREIEDKLVDRTVYEYLHICYYQKKRYQDAANALFTFLVAHPNHEASVEALKHYLTLAGVQAEDVVSLETPAYVSSYFKGVSVYADENYSEAAGLFETSLRLYLNAEEECRSYCEGPFDHGWYPEFTSSVANHFAYCLKCKRACAHALNNVNGDYRKDILRSHYNYLQFSYYKLGNLKAACSAVGSYLLFDPMDETMLYNVQYYKGQPKVREEYFAPRQEALEYVKRQEYEESLLRYISREFSVVDSKMKKTKKKKKKKTQRDEEKKSDIEAALRPPPGHSLFSHAKLSSNVSTVRHKGHEIRDTKQARVKDSIYLTATEEDLGGKNRYVADGFLNSSECESLMRFASMATVEGDGYSGNKSPHSKYERFEGITVGRTALMVYFGELEAERLQLFLEKTELVRDHVERYFGLDRPLYFSYTHLVCRTALPDSPMDRGEDLSHQVHADNCLLRDKDTCLRESPAYTWRDYSAILYLNDDFQGGEFFFTEDHQDREQDRKVSPRCGRTVAFSAGGENKHGVRGVIRGRRCALALWFTQDKRHLEYERDLAWAILDRVRRIGPFRRKDIQLPSKYDEVLMKYVRSDESLSYLFSSP